MKITVSYINSKNDLNKTIQEIDCIEKIDAIHADLMDGIYVTNKNFEIKEFINQFKNIKKVIDVHLMVDKPEEYVDDLFKINTNIIFFHPRTSDNPDALIEYIKDHNRKSGIVINPNEDCKDYFKYLEMADAVLIMSVTPGKGGQHFLHESLVNYELIKEQKRHFLFKLYVDGGINDETIEFVKDADGIVSGSFICNSDDYESQVDKLIECI